MWKRHYISKGGRITLMWSMMASIPIYLMSLLPISILVRMRIEQIQRDSLKGGGTLE